MKTPKSPNQAMEALMKSASHGSRKGRPEKLLADLMTDPKAYRLQNYKTLKLQTPTAIWIKSYEKIVLDEYAIQMAVRLAASKPIEMLHMLDAALPPSGKTWIEWPSRAMLLEQQAMQTEGLSAPASMNWTANRSPDARCGVMIETLPDAYNITCIEHAETDKLVYEWPVSFRIPKDSQTRFKIDVEVKTTDNPVELRLKGRGSVLAQAAILWGYGEQTKGLNNLARRGQVAIPSHMSLLLNAISVHNSEPLSTLITNTVQELAGITRLTVAILAMLHTSMEVDEPVRPKGRFISKSGPKPYSERRVARLLVPGRVRKVEEYVRSRIKEEGDRIRKRFHKVKAHYRHSHFLPLNGDGWTRCYCPGREPGKLWHKKIDEHWRGDETLGTVTRDFTLVSTTKK
jgi:hypothetical protein